MAGRRDFLRLLAAHEAGLLPMPVGPDERAIMAMTEPGPASKGRVVVEEARHGWWNGQGGAGLGQRFQGTIPSEGTERAILNIDKLGEPQVLTVALSRNDVRTGFPTNNSDVFARVRYGVGGYSDTLELDWATGMQFSVPATTVRVSAVSFRLNTAVAFNPRFLDLSAAVVKNPRPGALPPSRSIHFLLGPAGGGAAQVNVLIPDFARNLTVGGFEALATTIYDANTWIDFLHFNGGILAQYSGTEFVQVPAVVVPGEARTVTVRNTSANNRTISLTWGLCL